jgi:hypothetical protein
MNMGVETPFMDEINVWIHAVFIPECLSCFPNQTGIRAHFAFLRRHSWKVLSSGIWQQNFTDTSEKRTAPVFRMEGKESNQEAETDPVSETLWSFIFHIQDDG